MVHQLLKFASYTMAIVVLMFGSKQPFGQESGSCDGSPDVCIGMVIDSGDPVLVQMGHELSGMVSAKQEGVIVKPTAGPIANVRRLLSRENAGLSIVPSDMLLYTARSEDRRLRLATDRLRFIMTIGRKVVHVIARKDINRLEDLEGKRVATGPDNTALWVVSNNLLHLHGVTPSARLQLKPAEGIEAVLLDQADAAFVIGDAPLPMIQELSTTPQNGDVASDAKTLHMLELDLPATVTEYQPATVNYPGFADELETVAILPTLVSYDFTHKSTPYFRWRCRELARIGETVRSRLEELRATGHKQWHATSWEMEAGNWEKDSCFFGTAEAPVVSEAPGNGTQLARLETEDDVREAQAILNRLGYDSGPEDGILGPRTSAALEQFRTDHKIARSANIITEVRRTIAAATQVSSSKLSQAEKTALFEDYLRWRNQRRQAR